MAPYSPPTGGREGLLRLDFNENTAGCSPRVLRSLKKFATRDGLTVYPEYNESTARMAKLMGVGTGELIFTNGTDEAINAVVRTYADDGDEVIIPWPTFPMFKFYVEIQGAVAVTIPYRQPDLAFPLEELCRAVNRRTRAILIANPNNPTGRAIGLADIEKILRRAPRAAVFIDEAYYEFYGVTALKLLGAYPNLFVSRTFSKVYGLAALRVGLLMSQAANITVLRKDQSPYSVTSLGVHCALEAASDQAYVREYVREALLSRDLLQEGFAKLGVPAYHSDANFVLARFDKNTQQVCRMMRERGILIRDRSRELPGTARVTAGKTSQTKRFLRELREVLAACES